MSLRLKPLRVLALAFALSTSAHAATTYTFTELKNPGSDWTQAWDINSSGQVVTSSYSETAEVTSSFIYQGGAYMAVGGPAGAISTSAFGISDSGTIVGSYATGWVVDSDGSRFLGPDSGFILSGGAYTTLNVPGASRTIPRAISPNGRYVSGFYYTETSAFGFLYDTVSASFTSIGAGKSILLIAQGVTNEGVVVGNDVAIVDESTGAVSDTAFIYDHATGTRTDVSLPGGGRSRFRAIDSTGRISGFYWDAANVGHGFTGYPGSFQELAYPSATSTFVEGSNDAGLLVGTFLAGRNTGFIAVPVTAPIPEPETWALMLAGIALIAAASRRQSPSRRQWR